MQNINIKQTDNSPKIILDYDNGLIEFKGKSYPENTFEFFEPIIDWLKEYFEGNEKDITTINIKLTYFNSATTQVLFDIFDVINEDSKKELLCNWYYDANNEDGLEDYEDFSDEFELLNIQATPYKV